MSNTELALAPRFTVAMAKADKELVATIRAAVFPDSTDAELAVFLHNCERLGQHPLDRTIHPAVFKDNTGKRRLTIITGIDVFRQRSADTGLDCGMREEFGPDVQWGNLKVPSWCKVTVLKVVPGTTHVAEYPHTAYWSEFVPADPGKQFMWKKMPRTMLSKCAEAGARRKAFSGSLSTIYTKEEMGQSEVTITDEPATGEPVSVPVDAVKAVREATKPSEPESPDAWREDGGNDKAERADAMKRWFAVVHQMVETQQVPHYADEDSDAGKAWRRGIIKVVFGREQDFHSLSAEGVRRTLSYIVDKFKEPGVFTLEPEKTATTEAKPAATTSGEPVGGEHKVHFLAIVKRWGVVSVKSAANMKLLIEGLLGRRIDTSKSLGEPDYKVLARELFTAIEAKAIGESNWKTWCEKRIKEEAMSAAEVVKEDLDFETGERLSNDFEPVEVEQPITVESLVALVERTRELYNADITDPKARRSFVAERNGRACFVDKEITVNCINPNATAPTALEDLTDQQLRDVYHAVKAIADRLQ